MRQDVCCVMLLLFSFNIDNMDAYLTDVHTFAVLFEKDYIRKNRRII